MYDALRDAIVAHVGKDCHECELLTNGINKTYRCSVKGNSLYVRFTPANRYSLDDLKSELALLEKLKVHATPACRIPDSIIQPLIGPVFVDGVKYHGLVTEAAPGRRFSHNMRSAIAFGKSIAKLHVVSPTMVCQVEENVLGLQRSRLSFGRFEAVAAPIIEKEAKLASQIPKMTHGQCHGDAWPGNALYDQSQANLIDFEHQHYGPISYDIGTYLWWAFLSGAKSSNLGVGFFKGYRTYCNIDFSDRELRYQILMRELWNLEALGSHMNLLKDAEDQVTQRAIDVLKWVDSENLY